MSPYGGQFSWSWYAASVSAERISLLNTAPRSLPDLVVSKKTQDDDMPLQHAPLDGVITYRLALVGVSLCALIASASH